MVQDRNTILLPGKTKSGYSTSHKLRLSILRQLSFDALTLRSGAAVECDQGPVGAALLFLKGSPDSIRSVVDPDSVPDDFEQVSPHLLQLLLHHVLFPPTCTTLIPC